MRCDDGDQWSCCLLTGAWIVHSSSSSKSIKSHGHIQYKRKRITRIEVENKGVKGEEATKAGRWNIAMKRNFPTRTHRRTAVPPLNERTDSKNKNLKQKPRAVNEKLILRPPLRPYTLPLDSTQEVVLQSQQQSASLVDRKEGGEDGRRRRRGQSSVFEKKKKSYVWFPFIKVRQSHLKLQWGGRRRRRIKVHKLH